MPFPNFSGFLGGMFNQNDVGRTPDFNPRAKTQYQNFDPGIYANPQEGDNISPSFRNLYNQFDSSTPQIEQPSYLDANDPEILKLRDLYSKPSGAREMVQDYTSRRPQIDAEQYKPSFWRKLGTGLAAAGGMNYGQLEHIYREPYYNDLSKWTDEGKFIDDQTRFLEADRSREIKAAEFGLRTKNQAARQSALSEEARRRLNSGLARDTARDEDRDRDYKFKTEQAAESERRAKEYLNLARERGDLARDRFENPKYKPTQSDNPTEILKNTEASKELAFQRARTQSMFAPLFEFYDEQVSSGNKQPDFRAFVAEHPEYSGVLKEFRRFMDDYSARVMSQGRR